MPVKVLLADDNMTAQNMGRKILADAGFEVVAVSNGAAALKKFAELHPNILVLDIFMPGYSGLEVCEKIKAQSSVPVLLTVGKLEPFRAEEGSRVKADGIIIKPFEASDLVAAVEKLTSPDAKAAAAAAGARISNVPVTQVEEEEPYTTAQPFVVAEKAATEQPAAFAHANEPKNKTASGQKFQLDGIKVPNADPQEGQVSAKFQLENIPVESSGPMAQVVSAVQLGRQSAAQFEVEAIEPPPPPPPTATFELQPFDSLSEASAALPEIYALAAAAERAAAQAAMANRVVHEELPADDEVEISADEATDANALMADAESAISQIQASEPAPPPAAEAEPATAAGLGPEPPAIAASAEVVPEAPAPEISAPPPSAWTPAEPTPAPEPSRAWVPRAGNVDVYSVADANESSVTFNLDSISALHPESSDEVSHPKSAWSMDEAEPPVTTTEEVSASSTLSTPTDSRLGMSVDFHPEAAKAAEPASPASEPILEVFSYGDSSASEVAGESIPLDPEIESFDAMRIKQQITSELSTSSTADKPAPASTDKSSITAAVDRALSRLRDKIVAEIVGELSDE